MKKCWHPNIVWYVDSFYSKIENSVYFILEYADAGNLQNLIEEKWPLPEGLLIAIFYQICWAIKHLHEKCIIHQDIKCENVLLKTDGNLLVADFGLSYCIQYSK